MHKRRCNLLRWVECFSGRPQNGFCIICRSAFGMASQFYIGGCETMIGKSKRCSTSSNHRGKSSSHITHCKPNLTPELNGLQFYQILSRPTVWTVVSFDVEVLPGELPPSPFANHIRTTTVGLPGIAIYWGTWYRFACPIDST